MVFSAFLTAFTNTFVIMGTWMDGWMDWYEDSASAAGNLCRNRNYRIKCRFHFGQQIYDSHSGNPYKWGEINQSMGIR